VIITKKFEVLGSAGLCWPSLAFLAFFGLFCLLALGEFLSKNLPLLIEIKHNRPVSINQMSKPIYKQDSAI
jgi:hypothetical protein